MKTLLALWLLSTLAACSLTTNSKMASWVGASSDKLISQWGAPTSSSRLSDGREVLTWSRPWGDSRAWHVCRQNFVVSERGLIESFSYSDCSPI